MDLIEAIEKRISCRSFEACLLDEETFNRIALEVARINEESGLHFQLYGPREDGSVIEMASGMFSSNPPCYVALVGPTGPEAEERLGRYGEQLILFATQLGLGTCWVASTYDQATTRVELGEGEKLHCVVPIGYAPTKFPLKQRTLRAGLRSRDKKLDVLWQGSVPFASAPEWIQAAVIAAQKAPTAVNMQAYTFVQEAEDAPIKAVIPEVERGLEYIDLGIVKLHFELAAAACGVVGTWEWGSGGAFILA